MLWWHWSLLGLTFLGVEILTLGGLGNFYFLFFGVAALVVSGIVWMGLTEPIWLQWLLFALLGIVSLFVLRKPLQQKITPKIDIQASVDSIVGEVATLLEDLPVNGAGKAELRGSTWTVRNAGQSSLHKGERSRVIRVDGLTLWIQAEPPLQEEHHVG